MTHPQNQVPQAVFDDIARLVRRHQLDGPDLDDIAKSVDAEEEDFFWAGKELWTYLVEVTRRYPQVSAAFLLGWPVAS